MGIIYRKALSSDLAAIIKFVDFWLAGRGKRVKAAGASNDYFVSPKQHFDYQKKGYVLLAFDCDVLVGWCVKNHNNVLIHLLIAATHRGRGIGRKLIDLSNPELIRSKMDQQTGNPAAFYEKVGYVKVDGLVLGKNKNIEIYRKLNA